MKSNFSKKIILLQKEVDEKLRSNLMELIAEKTKVDLPEAMINTEVQYDIQY